MSFAFTPYGLELGLKFLFTDEAVTRPTAWYVARHIGTPNDTGSTNEETTGNDANYARLAVTFGASAWSSSLGEQVCASSTSLTFTPASGAGTRTYYGLSVWDAATSGNCLFVVSFGTYTVDASNAVPVQLPVGELMLSMSRSPTSPTSGLTQYCMQLMLDWLLTSGAATRPTAWYCSCHTADPGINGSSNELTTGVDSNYVRKVISFGNPVTTTGKGTECRNDSSVSWTPAAGTTYTVPYFGVFNASSGGTCLAVAGTVSPRSAPSVFSVNINQFNILGEE